jgi:hypothetical protein
VRVWRKIILLTGAKKEVRQRPVNVRLICGASDASFSRIKKLLIIRKDLVSSKREKPRLTSPPKLDETELREFSKHSD